MSIPIKDVVNTNDNVLAAGGSQVVLNGLLLTGSTYAPVGTLLEFSNASDVAAYFGAGSSTDIQASTYFAGYSIATSTPGKLYIYRYNSAAVAAYLRGGNVSGYTLTQLQAISGTLTLTVDAETHTSGTISLSAATSFSDAASIIQTGLRAVFTAAITVTYDTTHGAFIITSTTTGASSVITYATGTIASNLKLRFADGAVTSQGAAAATPAATMNAVKAVTLNWSTLFTTFEPVLADKLAFAAWINGEDKRYAYVCYDTDVEAITANSTTAFGVQCKTLGYNGIIPVWSVGRHAAFIAGIAASIDFEQTNNRPTFAFKQQSGLTASVTDQTTADILRANGYSFYGSWATSTDTFTFLSNGQISGAYQWCDSYFNQIWLRRTFENTLITLLLSVPSIPYGQRGNTMIATSLLDPIAKALNYGAIVPGIALSGTQQAATTAAAGLDISTPLFNQGYYLQVKDPSPTARQARQSPIINFWYMDGQAVQEINMTSTLLK